MGQTLSEPVTEKHTTVVQRGTKYWVALSDMQGWRISMEDAHSIHLHLPSPSSSSSSQPKQSQEDADMETHTHPSEIPVQPAGSTVSNDNAGEDGNALFGVFDGHGGSTVAKFTGTTLHTRLQGLESYKNGEYEKALKETFLKTDEDLRADPNFFSDPSGCTCVVTLFTTDGRIICANSGDSRAVLGLKGEAKPLSFDHKPTNTEETARITGAGGFVEFGRVNGNLALSRAIGDFEFKQNFSLPAEKQIVTADPDINTHKIDGEEEFLVVACDGIWDCMTSQQVIDFTRRAIAKGHPLGKIAEDMMSKCLAPGADTAGLGCDNMTVVIIALLGGRSREEWHAWVKDRVEKNIGYTTPESIPNLFPNSVAGSGFGGLTGAGGGPGGFRVSGAGGLANIASILGASGMKFKTADDDDDEDDSSEEGEDAKSNGSALNSDSSKSNASFGEGYMDDKALKEGTKPKDVTDKLYQTFHVQTGNTSKSTPKPRQTPSNSNSQDLISLLDEKTRKDPKSGSIQLVDDSPSSTGEVDADGDSHMASDEETDGTETETEAEAEANPDTLLMGQNKAHLRQSAQQPEQDALATAATGKGSPLAPSFTSMGSPAIPTPEALQSILHPSATSSSSVNRAPSQTPAQGESQQQSPAPMTGSTSSSKPDSTPDDAARSATDDASPQEQLKSEPQGDEMSGAVAVEGLMDGSEGKL